MSKLNIPKLKRKLDSLFSKYIRTRSKFCFTCPNLAAHCGHFQLRQFGMTRWHPKNSQPQCVRCNTFQYGEQYKFAKGLDRLYGSGTSEKLYELAHKNNYQDEVNTINDLIVCLNEHPENYEEVYYKLFKKYERSD